MGYGDNSKEIQEELDMLRNCLDDVKRKQDDFGKTQNDMAQNIGDIKDMVRQSNKGANPPSAMQSPRTSEGENLPDQWFWMHQKLRIPQILFEGS